MMTDPHIYKDYLLNQKPMYLDPHIRCLLGYGFTNTTNMVFAYSLGEQPRDTDNWSIIFDFPNYYKDPNNKYKDISLYISKRTRVMNIGLDENDKIRIRDNIFAPVYNYVFKIDPDEIRDDCFQITIDRYLDLCERMYKDSKGDDKNE